ncbi:hypothetical protein ACFQH8_01595 [Halomicroarcula sp. GCM10025710]
MSGTETEYLLVTEYFHPDTASTGQLMTDLAVGLQERGLDLSVYTGQPNYHSGENERQPVRSVHEGVFVRRIRAPQVRQSSLVRRLFNWTVFTAWMSVVLLFDQTDRERELVFVTCPRSCRQRCGPSAASEAGSTRTSPTTSTRTNRSNSGTSNEVASSIRAGNCSTGTRSATRSTS